MSSVLHVIKCTIMKTFSSYAFGCRVNQAEKEALDLELARTGYVFSPEKPDFYVVNTCSVTNKAEREAKQLIYQVKRSSPDTKVVVTGCAATNWIKQGVTVEGVDLIVDNQSKAYIAELIQGRLFKATKDEFSTSTVAIAPQQAKSVSGVNDKYLNSGRTIIKIQDGCHRFCSFCIVPYLRGLPKSVSVNRLIEHINGLDPSMQEVILAAINTQAYGYDTKESFVGLLEALMTKTTVPRISFGSIHPWSIDDAFFNFYKTYAHSKRFVHFFHIPLQSGSNKMLNLMKRGYTREEIIEKLLTIKKLNEFAFIGTDTIVGYFEESDRDFADTYSFLEQTPVSKFHIFRFSKRQHTAAYHLAKRLHEPSAQEKKKRAHALITLGEQKYGLFLQKHIGRADEALILRKRSDGLYDAVLSNQIPVCILSEKNLIGKIVPVQLTQFKNGVLFGTMGR